MHNHPPRTRRCTRHRPAHPNIDRAALQVHFDELRRFGFQHIGGLEQNARTSLGAATEQSRDIGKIRTQLADAIAEANRLPFGLAGYAFTNSLKTMHLLSQRLEVGMLWVNQPAAPWPEMPFGGIKDSGYGSEGGPEALEAYLNTKSVAIFNG